MTQQEATFAPVPYGRTLFVDVVGGVAGDMLLAALVDAGAPEEFVRRAIDAVIPGRFRFCFDVVSRAGIRALLLRIEDGPNGGGGATRALEPRPLADLLRALEDAPLDPPVRARARSVIERLGQAESRVHGVGRDELQLHELGDDDTLLDVVGVAAALEALGVGEVLVSPIPLGNAAAEAGEGHRGGHVHGGSTRLGPATLELLRGFAVRPGGEGETVTPTAAAVFAALGLPAVGIPAMRLEGIGYGAGSRDPAGYPNVVRVLVGTRTPDSAPTGGSGPPGAIAREGLALLETNLDDLTPQLVADAQQALLGAGALDAWTAPILMKKGRPGILLSALCDRTVEARVAEVFFESTTTFGVRRRDVDRWELARRMVEVALSDGTVRVKVGMLGGRVVTASPEHDDVVALAGAIGRSVRAVHEEAVAAARALALEEIER